MRIFAELFTFAESSKRKCWTVSNLKWFSQTTVFQKKLFAKLEITKKISRERNRFFLHSFTQLYRHDLYYNK